MKYNDGPDAANKILAQLKVPLGEISSKLSQQKKVSEKPKKKRTTKGQNCTDDYESGAF